MSSELIFESLQRPEERLNGHRQRQNVPAAAAAAFSDEVDSSFFFRSERNDALDVSFCSVPSKSTNGGGDAERPEGHEEQIVNRRSNRTAWCLKLIVIFLLVCAAATMASVVHLVTVQAQDQALQTAFDNAASKVFEYFKLNLERKLASLDFLSLEITSLALDTNATWPLITLPNFAPGGRELTRLAAARGLLFTPLVTPETREAYEAYTVENKDWFGPAVAYSEEYQASLLQQGTERQRRSQSAGTPPGFLNGFSDQIFTTDVQGGLPYVREENQEKYYPIRHLFPTTPQLVNYDLSSGPDFFDDYNAIQNQEQAVLGTIWDITNSASAFAQSIRPLFESFGINTDEPISRVFYPVFDKLPLKRHGELRQNDDKRNNGKVPRPPDRKMVAVVGFIGNTRTYFVNSLTSNTGSLDVVISNECDQAFSWKLQGGESQYLGIGDKHEPAYGGMAKTRTYQQIFNEEEQIIPRFSKVDIDADYCVFTIKVYPTQAFADQYQNNDALYYAIGVVTIFAFTIFMFLTYDFIVAKRQTVMMKQAVQSRAIVSSLFPAGVRDRLFHQNSESTSGEGRRNLLKRFIQPVKNSRGKQEKESTSLEKSIADFFPHTTVMFADIAGFTRWSSDRDPSDVFTLLQTVYGAFDVIAKKRNVFKVETIGDCYVAVTGLPDPQEDHTVRMVKFAHECRLKFKSLVEQIKEYLGEETGNLAMRFGLHSGPVTAGVLLGEKSRFQLFGTTVGTAEDIEKTGKPNKIHASAETAELLTAAGKGHWLLQRIDESGERRGYQTFWVEPKSAASLAEQRRASRRFDLQSPNQLISWNMDILKKLLQRQVAHRQDLQVRRQPLDSIITSFPISGTAIGELSDSITLPKLDSATVHTDPSTIDLGHDVIEQLEKLVASIASLYHEHAFHNFKHALHVCATVHKLLASILLDDIYQRTCEPLTNFAIMFAAMVHGIDHAGVPNSILPTERPRICAMYHNRCCAQQNSIDLAWNLLMDCDFQRLQQTLFHTHEELARFRKVFVNAVMSTDLWDEDLACNRESRLVKAFLEPVAQDLVDSDERANLRATVTVECAMQLAYLVHYTQHFSIFSKWNERLLEETYKAYETKRVPSDPSANWHQAELRFFDYKAVPTTERIKELGIFGAVGNNLHQNAMENRRKWGERGSDLVKSFLRKVLKEQEGEAPDESEQGIVDDNDQEQEEMALEHHGFPDLEPHMTTLFSDVDENLLSWNVDIFVGLLGQIREQRHHRGHTSIEKHNHKHHVEEGHIVLDEFSPVIVFRGVDDCNNAPGNLAKAEDLSEMIRHQLRDYLFTIAGNYRDHSFHNFRQASSMAAAAFKLLQQFEKGNEIGQKLRDPLTQFGILFSCIVHSVNHPGCPNALLISEGHKLAVQYRNQNISEQQAVDVAWGLLMQDKYQELRNAIYSDRDEMMHFRKLVVNCVLSTDLWDEARVQERKGRWAKAFGDSSQCLTDKERGDLQATLVAEQILMAALLWPAMQNWRAYCRWSESLYEETLRLYDDNRYHTDPAVSWYIHEIRFFDSIILPVAHQLKECDAFGFSDSDDVLKLAKSNRRDWIAKGGSLVNDWNLSKEDENKQNKAQLWFNDWNLSKEDENKQNKAQL